MSDSLEEEEGGEGGRLLLGEIALLFWLLCYVAVLWELRVFIGVG
jgi:hypothetical protein